MQFDGNYAQNLANKRVTVIYSAKGGRGTPIDKNVSLIVVSDPQKSICIKTFTMVNKTGVVGLMPLDVLEKFDSGIDGFSYSVSSDNKLILIKTEGEDIKVLHDKSGNCGIREMLLSGTNIASLKDENFQLKKGVKLNNGKVKILPSI